MIWTYRELELGMELVPASSQPWATLEPGEKFLATSYPAKYPLVCVMQDDGTIRRWSCTQAGMYHLKFTIYK